MKNAPFFVAPKNWHEKLALYISINKKVGGEYFGRPVSCNTWKIQQRADKKY